MHLLSHWCMFLQLNHYILLAAYYRCEYCCCCWSCPGYWQSCSWIKNQFFCELSFFIACFTCKHYSTAIVILLLTLPVECTSLQVLETFTCLRRFSMLYPYCWCVLINFCVINSFFTLKLLVHWLTRLVLRVYDVFFLIWIAHRLTSPHALPCWILFWRWESLLSSVLNGFRGGNRGIMHLSFMEVFVKVNSYFIVYMAWIVNSSFLNNVYIMCFFLE